MVPICKLDVHLHSLHSIYYQCMTECHSSAVFVIVHLAYECGSFDGSWHFCFHFIAFRINCYAVQNYKMKQEEKKKMYRRREEELWDKNEKLNALIMHWNVIKFHFNAVCFVKFGRLAHVRPIHILYIFLSLERHFWTFSTSSVKMHVYLFSLTMCGG